MESNNAQEREIAESRKNIEIAKLKKIIRRLQTAKITGSVITLTIAPKKAIHELTQMLNEQLGRANCIKDKTNKLSVIDALTSARQKIKLYKKVPKNGLLLFCGTVIFQNCTMEKRIVYDIEPPVPISHSYYRCSPTFHLDEIKQEVFHRSKLFGFIIVDGEGAMYATLQGNFKKILYKFQVDLVKKHNKGGQSAVRFERLRDQNRHNYLRFVCEYTAKLFLTDNKCNVQGLILAGSADFKNQLNETDMLDPRIKQKIILVTDVAYGFHNGLNQAIDKSSQCINNQRLIKQKNVLQNFFQHLAKGTGFSVYGIKETIQMLKMKAIKTFICYQDLKLNNFANLLEEELSNESEDFDFVQWMIENHEKYGCKLQLIGDKISESHQFIKGFGGIGGILKFKMDQSVIQNFTEQEEQSQLYSDDDEFI